MMCVRLSLSLRNVEGLPFERGVEICHEILMFWWNPLGLMVFSDIWRQGVSRMRGIWRWQLGEVFCIDVPATDIAQLAALPLASITCGPDAPAVPLHAGRGDAEVGGSIFDAGTMLTPP